MLTIKDYKKPDSHPFGMLRGEQHASEKESFMAWCLSQCIKSNNLDAEFETVANEDVMVTIDMLEKVADKTYRLTRKAKGLLYAHYGKS